MGHEGFTSIYGVSQVVKSIKKYISIKKVNNSGQPTRFNDLKRQNG